MRAPVLLCAIALVLNANAPVLHGEHAPLFAHRRIWSDRKATTGALLNDGTVVLYFEETRPPTEEEKARRAEEFDRQWQALQAKAKDLANKQDERNEKAKSESAPPFVLAILSAFLRWMTTAALQTAYPIAKNAFVNTPVVTKAGFAFVSPQGTRREMLLDLAQAYGPETWQRMADAGVQIRASQDNRFVALETEKAGLALYALRDATVTLVGRFEGRHPFGFSRDGTRMFVTLDRGVYRVFSLPPKGQPVPYVDYIPFVPGIPSKLVRIDYGKGVAITDVLLAGRYLLVLTWTELIFYDLEQDTVTRRLSFRRYGGRSLLAGSDDELYVAEMDGTVTKVDLATLQSQELQMERFDLLRNHRVYFHKLVSVSPTKRFLAALYDPRLIPPRNARSWSGGSTNEARLFIWDMARGEVAWRMDKRLKGVTGGFGYQPPAAFTEDWRYLLLNLTDGGLELWANW